jgi:hypothetical protein
LAPGVQVPEQTPPLQTFGHALPLCHWPLVAHVCGTRPLHCFAPGEHTPVQAVPTHAWFVQVAGAPQSPLPLHVWYAELPEHCVAPGVHTPVHASVTQAEFTHAVVFPHAPFASHVWVLFPEHRADPGVQTPVHPPPTHA